MESELLQKPYIVFKKYSEIFLDLIRFD